MDASTAPPPIPRQSQSRQMPSRRKDPPSAVYAPSSTRNDSRRLASSHSHISPASPEVISSLITSLSVISQPANSHFDNLPGTAISTDLSIPRSPASPTGGSFGVDYGAFSSSHLSSHQEEDVSLDELAASAPVIRTSKPPSGFSPLTAPKSTSRETESSGGLKSLLSRGRNSASRPSSRGSLASRDADTQSIGNLSIERGTVSPAPELRRKGSHDSWGKKTGRAHKGLMYMSSKEQLREKEEKKRASIDAVGGAHAAARRAVSPRPDPFLAETAIREEPNTESPRPDRTLSTLSVDNAPRPIPARDSSLRKTGSNAKRSSKRTSKRNSESTDIIRESEEHHSSHNSSKANSREASARRGRPRQEENGGKMGAEALLEHHRKDSSRQESWDRKPLPVHIPGNKSPIEEGAPSPAVAQGRRRDRSADDRRRSGRQTPEPLDGLKLKRSSSKLKRLSGQLSPREDKRNASIGSRPLDDPNAHHVGYERPPSADSIDDAVESYLCSPRLSQKIKHPQTGRVISFSEVGDSEGSAVFCCVGMGLTRYITAFYDELALTLKLRLITPDRPGVGDSEAYADGTATPLSWPDDVYAICQALKITKFSILAHSAGAIYALATALRMPQHIRGRIHLLAPWIPPSQMSVFGASAQTPLPPTNAIPTSQRILRALPTPLLKAANSSFMSATSSSITSSLPKTPKRKRKSNATTRDASRSHPAPAENKENLADIPGPPEDPKPAVPAKDNSTMEDMDRIRPLGASPTSSAPISSALQDNGRTTPSGHRKSPSTASAAHAAREAAVLAAAASALADKERQATYDTRLTHAIWDLATTGANPAVDLLVCLERRHTIGFRYVDITRPVVIHHGSRDTRVPVENVRWLGKTMRRCEVRVLEGEGHGLMASAAVMGGVLMEMSKEWEDWGRLTGVGGRGRGRESERERERKANIGTAR